MTRTAEWQRAVRDHPDRPPPEQRLVLDCLTLRLDWKTGTGFASAAELAQDADVGERTVRRATSWARRAGLLDLIRRGHRLGDGRLAASEWRLVIPPSQPDTPDTLTASQPDSGRISTGQRERLNRTAQHPHQDLSISRPVLIPRARAAADSIRAVYPDATDDEIEIIISDRTARGARSAEAVIAHEIREGRLRLPCDVDGPHGHSNACRDGDSLACGMAGCICRCHTEPKEAAP